MKARARTSGADRRKQRGTSTGPGARGGDDVPVNALRRAAEEITAKSLHDSGDVEDDDGNDIMKVMRDSAKEVVESHRSPAAKLRRAAAEPTMDPGLRGKVVSSKEAFLDGLGGVGDVAAGDSSSEEEATIVVDDNEGADDDDEEGSDGEEEESDNEKEENKYISDVVKFLSKGKPQRSEKDEAQSSESSDNSDNSDEETPETEEIPVDLTPQPDGGLTLLHQQSFDAEMERGQHVKHQRQLWDKFLDLRIRLQPLVIMANSLPLPEQQPRFRQINSSGYESAISSVSSLLDNLNDISESLYSRIPDMRTGDGLVVRKRAATTSLDELWADMESRQKAFDEWKWAVIGKWEARTKVADVSKQFTAINLGLVEHIKSVCENKTGLLKRTQVNRTRARAIGAPKAPKVEKGPLQPGQLVVEAPVGKDKFEPEMFDDNDWYPFLFHDLSDNSSLPEEGLDMLRLVQDKQREKKLELSAIHRRIRYDIHTRLANFMAPVVRPECWENPNLFNNMFGRTTQQTQPAGPQTLPPLPSTPISAKKAKARAKEEQREAERQQKLQKNRRHKRPFKPKGH
ncbi:apoptosis-antagonizing transcription factor [Pelomyxa schiedti]|nr:apoptosis-antagonizing transcription factor [Pelomyxa schiedti]